MNKWCDNCKYYRNNYGYGQCYAQKNAPRVDYNHCCENFIEYEEEKMTNEEAIEDIKNNVLPVVGGKSLVMAIKALEEQSKGECEEKLSDEEKTIKKIIEKIDYVLNDINPYSNRDRDFSIAQTARELSEAYKNLAIIQLTENAPTIGPRIEYGTDGQPYELSISGGHVVPNTLQGWRYEEEKSE